MFFHSSLLYNLSEHLENTITNTLFIVSFEKQSAGLMNISVVKGHRTVLKRNLSREEMSLNFFLS